MIFKKAHRKLVLAKVSCSCKELRSKGQETRMDILCKENYLYPELFLALISV